MTHWQEPRTPSPRDSRRQPQPGPRPQPQPRPGPRPQPPRAEPSRRALVVDDEVGLARLIAGYLQRDGYAVLIEHDGAAAVAAARQAAPDVVILDLNLPGLDGIEVCRQIRTFSDCYIVMLTARAEEVDTLIGLSVGADDYMTKPFSPRELSARVAALMRRPRAGGPAGLGPAPDAPTGQRRLAAGPLGLDLDSREAHLGAVPLDLTRIEFDLLAALALRPGTVLTRFALVEAVWGSGWVGDERIVDVHIAHVRRKLSEAGAAQSPPASLASPARPPADAAAAVPDAVASASGAGSPRLGSGDGGSAQALEGGVIPGQSGGLGPSGLASEGVVAAAPTATVSGRLIRTIRGVGYRLDAGRQPSAGGGR